MAGSEGSVGRGGKSGSSGGSGGSGWGKWTKNILMACGVCSLGVALYSACDAGSSVGSRARDSTMAAAIGVLCLSQTKKNL